MASKQGREDYLRVRLEAPADPESTGGLPLAVPVPGLSGLLRTLLDAQGLVRIDADLEGLEQGAWWTCCCYRAALPAAFLARF